MMLVLNKIIKYVEQNNKIREFQGDHLANMVLSSTVPERGFGKVLHERLTGEENMKNKSTR